MQNLKKKKNIPLDPLLQDDQKWRSPSLISWLIKARVPQLVLVSFWSVFGWFWLVFARFCLVLVSFWLVFGWFWLVFILFLVGFWLVLVSFWLVFGWFWMVFGRFLVGFGCYLVPSNMIFSCSHEAKADFSVLQAVVVSLTTLVFTPGTRSAQGTFVRGWEIHVFVEC